MRGLKIALFILGTLGLLAGLLFIGQGTGFFPYPRQSFMISEMPWAYRGAGIAAVSLVMLGVAWRI